MRYLLLTTIFGSSALFAEELNVYTYDSFASEWGPGPELEKNFEATCGCDLVFTTAGDGAALLTRLRLEGAHSKADLVLGLDQNLAKMAIDSDLLAVHPADQMIAGAKTAWKNDYLTAYDWGQFAFVYRKDNIPNPPQDFEALADSSLKIIIEDPRSSTPGLGLVAWVYALYGDRSEEIWAQLADNIVTVTPGWSEAYSLFLEGHADMVLSYTTSPAYHAIAENDQSFAAAPFREGHGAEIELMGILKSAKNPELAASFMDFILTSEAQNIISQKNWMFPVQNTDLPAGFTDPTTYHTIDGTWSETDISAAKEAYEAGMK